MILDENLFEDNRGSKAGVKRGPYNTSKKRQRDILNYDKIYDDLSNLGYIVYSTGEGLTFGKREEKALNKGKEYLDKLNIEYKIDYKGYPKKYYLSFELDEKALKEPKDELMRESTFTTQDPKGNEIRYDIEDDGTITVYEGDKVITKGKTNTEGAKKVFNELGFKEIVKEGYDTTVGFTDKVSIEDAQEVVDEYIKKFGRVGARLLDDLDQAGYYIDNDNKVQLKVKEEKITDRKNEEIEKKLKPTIYNILGWLKNHEQAYKDFKTYFKLFDNGNSKMPSLEDIKGWISDHKVLTQDYENFFDDKINESFNDSSSARERTVDELLELISDCSKEVEYFTKENNFKEAQWYKDQIDWAVDELSKKYDNMFKPKEESLKEDKAYKFFRDYNLLNNLNIQASSNSDDIIELKFNSDDEAIKYAKDNGYTSVAYAQHEPETIWVRQGLKEDWRFINKIDNVKIKVNLSDNGFYLFDETSEDENDYIDGGYRTYREAESAAKKLKKELSPENKLLKELLPDNFDSLPKEERVKILTAENNRKQLLTAVNRIGQLVNSKNPMLKNDWKIIKNLLRDNNLLKEELTQEEQQEYGLNTLVNQLIRSEYDAIDDYNSAIVTFEAEGQGEYTDVIRSIIEDERHHIGNLQEIMNRITPGTEAEFEHGKEEAIETLDEEKLEDEFKTTIDTEEGVIKTYKLDNVEEIERIKDVELEDSALQG